MFSPARLEEGAKALGRAEALLRRAEALQRHAAGGAAPGSAAATASSGGNRSSIQEIILQGCEAVVGAIAAEHLPLRPLASGFEDPLAQKRPAIAALAHAPDIIATHVPELLRLVSRLLQGLLNSPDDAGAGSSGSSLELITAITSQSAVCALARLVRLAAAAVSMVGESLLDNPTAFAGSDAERLLASAGGSKQLEALAACADAVGAVMSSAYAAETLRYSCECMHALGLACQLNSMVGRLFDLGLASRPATTQLLRGLQHCGLLEAACRTLLLAAERLPAGGRGGGTPGDHARWNAGAHMLLFSLVHNSYRPGFALQREKGATPHPALAVLRPSLCGPAVTRFVRCTTAAVLQLRPQPALPPGRRGELLELLPGAGDEVVALLLSTSAGPVQPLPAGVVLSIDFSGSVSSWEPVRALQLASQVLLLQQLDAPGGAPDALGLAQLHLAWMGIGLRGSNGSVLDALPSGLSGTLISSSSLLQLPDARAADPRRRGEALALVLHTYLVVALLALQDAHRPGMRGVEAAVAVLLDDAISFMLELIGEGLPIQAREALSDALVQTSARQLADEVLRGCGRCTWGNSELPGTATPLVHLGCSVANLLLNLAEGHKMTCYGHGIEIGRLSPAEDAAGAGSEPVLGEGIRVRRAARQLGALLTALKLARLVCPALLLPPAAGHKALPRANQVARLLAMVELGTVRPRGNAVRPYAEDQVVLMAMWPLAFDACIQLASAVLHSRLRGARAGGLWRSEGDDDELLALVVARTPFAVISPVLCLLGARLAPGTQQLPASTRALLQQALQAPGVEQLLALSAEYLEKHQPLPGTAQSVADMSFKFRDTLCYVLAGMATNPLLHHRVRGWLLAPAQAAPALTASQPGCSGVANGAVSYDVAALRVDPLAVALWRHHKAGERLLDIELLLLVQRLCATDGPLEQQEDEFMRTIRRQLRLPAPEVGPGVEDARRLLRLCGNPACTSLEGPSEQDLPRMRCGRCAAVCYCSATCQAQHWRAGHKQACVSKPPAPGSRAAPTSVCRPPAGVAHAAVAPAAPGCGSGPACSEPAKGTGSGPTGGAGPSPPSPAPSPEQVATATATATAGSSGCSSSKAPSLDELMAKGPRELKRLLAERGGDARGCVDKRDLARAVLAAWG